MRSDKLIPAWYVVHTKSRFENVVYDALLNKSFDTFLPKIKVRSKRRDRKLMIKVPLFPGYIFVKTDLNPNQHLDIVKTVGAVKLIGSNTGPVSVPEETIKSLKIMVAGDEEVTTGTQYSRGDCVLVIAGPFAGVIGIFDHYRGKGRIVVHIEALGQFAAVDVSEDDVEKLPPTSA